MEGIVIKTEPGTGPIIQQENEEDGGGHGVKMEEGKPNCGCDCCKENRLLRRAIVELGKGKALLEDYLQVEFGEKFASFVVKRDHLIGLGFGRKDADNVEAVLPENRDLTKSSELVDLLTMIKEQDQVNSSKKENVEPSPPQPGWISYYSSSPTPSALGVQTLEDIPVPSPPPERELVWETPAQMQLQSKAKRSTFIPKPIRICPICKAQVHRRSFTTHLLDLHQEDKEVTCTHCRLPFDTRRKLAAHLQEAHKFPQHKAEVSSTARVVMVSGVPFLDKPELASPYGNGWKRVCPFCGELKPRNELREHLGQTHQDKATLSCSICGKEFDIFELRGHLAGVHQLEQEEIDWITDLTGGKMEGKIGPWQDRMVKEANDAVWEHLHGNQR